MIKNILITALFSTCFLTSHGQSNELTKEIEEFHKELNEEFANPEESPLTKQDLETFKSLDFFPIDLKYRIVAKFVRTPDQKPFKMATTTTRSPIYEKYGEAHFELNGQEFVLEVYQSHELKETEEYKDYLFLPFTDLSNGEETYGGGRYLGLTIPEADTVVLDFNRAYNPYCAYNKKYSCPLVPRQNRVRTKVLAGVKAFKSH
ncbi:DUF1684 domain-containing protein [Fulvivirga sp. 29W222]|uniref:DUF1684 domain-containing protein n=1 Tax=Fulvivirga marina TaxID=2494733 RepID=A0A937FZM9_9BACT|nr:DUF1684 domain-containing protein [Fulvivirga marina]MBL6447426.1 DUF1684 domain-containing protein [Fulvivirga marina]